MNFQQFIDEFDWLVKGFGIAQYDLITFCRKVADLLARFEAAHGVEQGKSELERPYNEGSLMDYHLHQRGMVEVNDIGQFDPMDADFGLQVATDGRIWVCVNGTSFVRFKPRREG